MALEVYRKEIKYGITRMEYCRMESALAACLDRDPHDGGEGYEVRSLYFDSYGDGDCQAVLDGVENKQKVRLRIYDPSARSAQLEFKCKTGSDGRKQSLQLTREQALRMLEGNYEGLLQKGEVGKELFARMVGEAYLPKVMVCYRRHAFAYESNNIRVTFDFQIGATVDKWALFEETPCLEPVISQDVGVLEVKYDGFLFSFIKEILEAVNALPMANSKYVQARLLY